jgi:hypothetical protein
MGDEQWAVYEITLHGAPPAGLTARFPSLTLFSVPAATVLSRRVVDLAEIDGLIEQLRAIGITPIEMRVSFPHCEVRVEGRLGDSIVRYMRWSARFEPERTVIRVLTTGEQLQLIVDELVDSGTGVDHLIRRQAA